MKENYEDILSRITEVPKWFDQNGVPRYDEFHPRYCPNIYASRVILLKIACQACGKLFNVEMHYSDWYTGANLVHPSRWHYGDPPIHDCVGDSMNCEDIEVLQVWARDALSDWVRCPHLEGPIE